jgi:CheY-like chemotaxis protein
MSFGVLDEHLAVTDDGVHGRTQLVAHVGQEGALGAVGGLGLHARLLHLARALRDPALELVAVRLQGLLRLASRLDLPLQGLICPHDLARVLAGLLGQVGGERHREGQEASDDQHHRGQLRDRGQVFVAQPDALAFGGERLPETQRGRQDRDGGGDGQPSGQPGFRAQVAAPDVTEQTDADDDEARRGVDRHPGQVSPAVGGLQIGEVAGQRNDGEAEGQGGEHHRTQGPAHRRSAARVERRSQTDQHEADGGIRGHASRLGRLDRDVVLHEELVDTEVDREGVLQQGQAADEHGDGPGKGGAAHPAEDEQEQRAAAEQEARCGVVLHRDEGGHDLHERPAARVPAGDDQQSQQYGGGAAHEAGHSEDSRPRPVGRSFFRHGDIASIGNVAEGGVPEERGSQPQAAARSRAVRGRGESMARILLVEDQEMNRDMLSRRLKKRGYEVSIAVDGAEGVEKARSESPDLILMDMSLPVMDGWEATRTLKGDEATRSIPVVALTAHAMSTDREKALEAGCDAYETKPVELPKLLGTMEKLLGAVATD